MDHFLKLTFIFEVKLNREDTKNGSHYKDKSKVELGAILSSMQLYL